MKIVHVISYFQPHLGYQELYLAREQQCLGHHVAVVTSDRYHPDAPLPNRNVRKRRGRYVGRGRYIEEGIPVYRLRCLVEYRTACVLLGLDGVLEQLKPEVVHCHGIFYNFAAWQVARLRRKVGFRLLYDTHEADFNTDVARSWAKRRFHQFFKKAFIPRIKSEADAIVAIGPEEQEFICRECDLPLEMVEVIPLGVDTRMFRFDPEAREVLRRKLNIAQEETLFLLCGGIAPRKEPEVLLTALSLVRQQGMQAVALVVGSGRKNYVESLKKLAENLGLTGRIRWLDFVDKSRLPGIMSAADVGVWPGDPSIAAQEAISTGLPVILQRGGPGEASDADLLVANGNGLRFRRGDPVGLADRMASLIRDTELRVSMRKLARRLAEEQLSWPVIAQRFERAYTGKAE